MTQFWQTLISQLQSLNMDLAQLLLSLPFWHTESRLFWLFILTSLLLAVGYLLLTRQPVLAELKQAFGWSIWFHPSSRLDYVWFLLNGLLRLLLLIPILGSSFLFALWINRQLYFLFGQGDFFSLPAVWVMLLFTVVLFVVEDFSRFLLHFAYHKIPLLWRFHAVHHSAEVMTPITLFRIHSLEMLINYCRDIVVIGLVSGLFLYLFKGAISGFDIMGVGALGFLMSALGSNLRHSQLWLSFGALEKFFISPAQHQIHHSASPEHYDRNFGTWLSIWDRLFNSLVLSKGQKDKVRFGLNDAEFSRQWLKQLKGFTPKRQV